MRKPLIAAMAFAAVAVFAMPGVAAASPFNINALPNAQISPSEQPAASFGDAGLFVETSTVLVGGGTATTPTKEPIPTKQVNLHFDRNIGFEPGTVPACTTPLGSLSTQNAFAACSASHVGSGYATLCAASGGPGTNCNVGGDPSAPGVINAVLSVFNGPVNGNGNPTVLFHARVDHTPLGPVTQMLTGEIKKSNQGGASSFKKGKQIEVPVPLLPAPPPDPTAGAVAITDFAVNVNNDNYVKAKCNDDMIWQYRAIFQAYNQPPPAPQENDDTVNATQNCTNPV